ncbi:hypothetical protein RB195_026345 [Necator americanus]|uniref:Endonuclease/exonuclease/phosphatase domain-containing protein n=1 Tax=Necator americanus TaxID=51031 RepID=A0ABR1EWH9_NECAM
MKGLVRTTSASKHRPRRYNESLTDCTSTFDFDFDFVSAEARAYPRSDSHCPRPGNVANMRGLPEGGQSRPKKLVRHRQQHPLRLVTLNVGTRTGRSRELADSLRKRRVDICCVQETRWKVSKSRELGYDYKLIYHCTSNSNGIGIILNESFRNSVTAEDLEQYVQFLEGEEVLLIGGDFNGSRKDGFESSHGGYGYRARNDDGLRILEYAVASDLIIANTQTCRCPTPFARHGLESLPSKKKTSKDRNTANQMAESGRPKGGVFASVASSTLLTLLVVRRKCGRLLPALHDDLGEHSGKDDSRRSRTATMLCTTCLIPGKARGVYSLVRARHRSTLNMEHTKIVKGADGAVLRRSSQILERWREYYNHLCNEELCQPPIPTVPTVGGPILLITAVEVSALAKMKSNKATVPDDILADVWKLLGDRGPLRLLCHTMKVFERVLEACLRKIVSVSLNQCGFVKDCSTIDAIHAVRILLEKHREENRSVHLAFLDLEKAFDRTPMGCYGCP